MKGTLLVLALLVTAQLDFQTVEACPIFYDVFLKVVIGARIPLNLLLNGVNATEAEKAAVGKIQDCHNEGGLATKLSHTKALVKISISNECTQYVFKEAIQNLLDLFSEFSNEGARPGV